MVTLCMLTILTIELKEAWLCDLSAEDIYRVRTLAASDQGVVAIIDRDAGSLAMIESGNITHRVQAKGQGPGELQQPVEITWLKDGQVFVVMDYGNSRFSLWSENGRFVRESSFSNSLFFAPRFKKPQIGFFAIHFGALNGDPALVRYDMSSKESKTLWSLKPPTRDFSNAGTEENPIRMLFRWDPTLSFDLGSDFIAVTFGDQDHVDILDVNGKRISAPIKVRLPRFPITDAQVEYGINHLPMSMHANLRQNVVKPKSWQHIRALFVDDSDRIWVFGAAPDVDKPQVFKVYNRKGKELASGKVDGQPLDLNSSGLYTLKRDAKDRMLVSCFTYSLP